MKTEKQLVIEARRLFRRGKPQRTLTELVKTDDGMRVVATDGRTTVRLT